MGRLADAIEETAWLKVCEDLRVSEGRSGAAFLAARIRAWRSAFELHGVEQARQELVYWCRGMGVREPVLRKDTEAEGAKAVSPRWVDTDKGEPDRPRCRSRLVVREIKKAMKNPTSLLYR